MTTQASTLNNDYDNPLITIEEDEEAHEDDGVCSGWGQNDTLRPEITWFSICIRP